MVRGSGCLNLIDFTAFLNEKVSWLLAWLIDDPILLQTELNVASPRASHPQQPYPLMHSLSNSIRRKRRRRRRWNSFFACWRNTLWLLEELCSLIAEGTLWTLWMPQEFFDCCCFWWCARQLLLLTPRTHKFAKLRSFINKNCNDVKWVVRKTTTPDSTIDRDVAKACQQQAWWCMYVCNRNQKKLWGEGETQCVTNQKRGASIIIKSSSQMHCQNNKRVDPERSQNGNKFWERERERERESWVLCGISMWFETHRNNVTLPFGSQILYTHRLSLFLSLSLLSCVYFSLFFGVLLVCTFIISQIFWQLVSKRQKSVENWFVFSLQTDTQCSQFHSPNNQHDPSLSLWFFFIHTYKQRSLPLSLCDPFFLGILELAAEFCFTRISEISLQHNGHFGCMVEE